MCMCCLNCFSYCIAADQIDQPVLGPVQLLVVLGGATYYSVVDEPSGVGGEIALPNSMIM